MPTSPKACISFRIGIPLWMPDARFDELLALFDKYRGVTDEVTLFTAETHPCLPLPVLQERAALLAVRMDRARAHGYRTGINHLATIGHHNENLPHALTGAYTPFTDIDGQACAGARCPNDDHFRAYIAASYRALAEARPDYLWIDDDVRLHGHLPIIAGCFCETCLAIFADEIGTRYTRESLKAAFNAGAVEATLLLRTAWLAHNRRLLGRLLSLIETTVHALAPAMPLGFMTGDRFYEGYDFDVWADILAGPERRDVRWRPGGGFYSDETLPGMVDKSHQIGRQIALLPDTVVTIQSEIENFPYQRLKKAARTTALEAAAHLAAGCTGTAFNVLQPYDEPLDEYEPLVAALQRARPFCDLLAAAQGRARPQGLCAAWSKESFAVSCLQGRAWPDAGESVVANVAELHEIGLPAAYHPRDARVTALAGDAALALSAAEIRALLSRGVYLDGPALNRLNAMGYGDCTGFTVAGYHDTDGIEELLPHALNGPHARRKRDCRQSFRWWNVPAAALIPASPVATPLSRLVDYAGAEMAACTAGVFENALGGRVCVAGYFPWTLLQTLPTSTQLKAIARWLSRDTLPAYVASYHKVNLWVREIDGGLAVTMLNPSLDDACDIELRLRTAATTVTVYDMACSKTEIVCAGADGPYARFILPRLPSWQMVLATTT